MKKMKNEIKKRKVVKEEYYWICPICSKEIKHSHPKSVEFNIKVHNKTHKRMRKNGS